MKDTTVNMTEGSTIGLLIRFSIPMLIGNLFQQVYNLADSIIVGRLINADALAAIGATSSITFFFFALCNGFASGGGIIVSQNFGEGDADKVRNSMLNTAYIMFFLPLIVGLTAYILATPILRVLDTPEVIMDDAAIYMRTQCIGMMFVSLYNLASSMMRSLGDSKTPLYFLIFSCILNVILDIVFVYNLGLGVWGAGAATVLSQLVSGVLCLIKAVSSNPYFKFKKADMRVNHGTIASIVKLGIPISLQYSLIAISCMALQRVVNGFGAVAVAAFTATGRIEQLAHQPYQSLTAALTTFAGQNYGAKKNRRAIEGYRKSLLLMGIYTLVMVPLIQIFAEPVSALFVNEADVIQMGARALRITSLFYVFLGVIYVVRGILSGIGDAFFALFNGVVEIIGRFTVPIGLTMIPAVGVWGIWWSVGIVWFISGFTAWLRYVYIKKRRLTDKAEDASGKAGGQAE